MPFQILFGVGSAIYFFNQGETFLASLSIVAALPLGIVSMLATVGAAIGLFKNIFL